MTKIPGEFVPLDIHYLRDRAIRKAGPDAELLYIRGLAHSKAGRTNGFIADFDLEIVAVGLNRVQIRVQKLVENNLWVATDDGWLIRSWDKWNASPEAIEKRRIARRNAAILTNHKRWHKEEISADCPHCTESLERSLDRSVERSQR